MTVSLLALPLGLVIGLAVGALGGGGSILTVPALVYAVGESPASATTASLVIVGVTALTGAVGHARHGRVRWNAGVVFGIVGIAGSLVGSHLNRRVDPNILLLAFAGLMLVAAAAMLLRDRSPTVAAEHPAVARTLRQTAERVLTVALAGTAVGFTTGFLGVGGGFVVVPVLVLALGFTMGDAVGTALVVITINAMAALAARTGSASIDWSVVAPFTLAAMLGSALGYRVTGRVAASTLTRAFASLLVALAVYVAVRSILALT